MCISPILIPNPSRVSNPRERLVSHPLERRLDLTSQYIPVRCGHCVECVRLQQNYWIQRFRLMASCSDMYFQTLTIKPDMAPHMRYDLQNGDTFDHEVVTRDMLQKYFKLLRKYNVFGAPFMYFAVSEYGGKRHRPHFHVVYFVPKTDEKLALKVSRGHRLSKLLLKMWCRNDGEKRTPVYVPYCEYHQKFVGDKLVRNYDFHYITPSATANGETDVGFYVSKYILKASEYVQKVCGLLATNLPPEPALQALREFKPFSLVSKHFGFPDRDKWHTDFTNYDKLIQLCKTKSLRSMREGSNPLNSFLFYTPNGQAFPLSPYLRKKLITASDSMEMTDIQMSREERMTDYDNSRYNDLDFDRVANAERDLQRLRNTIKSIETKCQF